MLNRTSSPQAERERYIASPGSRSKRFVQFATICPSLIALFWFRQSSRGLVSAYWRKCNTTKREKPETLEEARESVENRSWESFCHDPSIQHGSSQIDLEAFR